VEKYSYPYDFGTYDYGYGKKDKSASYRLLYSMSRSEMLDMAYTDPETFVAMVREELFDEVPRLKQDIGGHYADDDYWFNHS
jgi:hypothetical protein